MSDPIMRLAHLKLITDSAALEAEIDGKIPGYFVEIYRRFRKNAAEAITALGFVDPDEPKLIRALQVRIKVFDEFIAHARSVLSEGIQFDQEITDEERRELFDILMSDARGVNKAIEMGLIEADPPGAGAA